LADIQIHRDALKQLFVRHDDKIAPAVFCRKRATEIFFARLSLCFPSGTICGGRLTATNRKIIWTLEKFDLTLNVPNETNHRTRGVKRFEQRRRGGFRDQSAR
jgi:hypothetical protein